MTVTPYTSRLQSEIDKVLASDVKPPILSCTILLEWIADEDADDSIDIDLRGCTLRADSLNLEPSSGARNLKISNGCMEVADGVRVKHLDSLSLENMSIRGQRTGIIIRESCVTLRDCTMTGKGTIAVVIDSIADFIDCQLRDSESGDGLVVMGSRAVLTASGCDILGNFGSGVRVLRNAQISMTNCTIKGSATSVGMAITGMKSEARVSSCEILENQKNGIIVAEGGFLELHDSVIQDTKEYHGLTVQDANTMVTVTQCDIVSSDQCGVYISEAATVKLDQCVVKGSRTSSGVSIQGQSTSLEAKSCEFIDNQQCAVVVAGGACCALSGCVGKRSADLYGLGVSGVGTFVEVNACHFSHNKLCGVYVHGGARVILQRCVARGGKLVEGYSSIGFGSSSDLLLKPEVNGFGNWNRNGISVMNGATATLTECVSKVGGLSGMTIVGSSTSVVAKKCDLGGESRDPRLEDAFSTLF